MYQLFKEGGPIMWPLLLTSIVALTVVLERIVFIFRILTERDKASVQKIFELVEHGRVADAASVANKSSDFVARTLTYGLQYREESLTHALLRQSNIELMRFNRGISVLDTVITLSPLLGLLGTVTGMIHAFSLLGGQEIGAPTAITGGIAEALIATAFGLGIAIISLIPFNFLTSRMEQARREIEDAATHLELLLHRAPRLRDSSHY